MGPLDAAGINNASAEADADASTDADASGQFRICQTHWLKHDLMESALDRPSPSTANSTSREQKVLLTAVE